MTTLLLDAPNSHVGFSVRHLMFSKVHGRFARATATVDVASQSVRAEIDAASVETGDESRDAFLRSAEFFDVARHPTIAFEGAKTAGSTDAFTLRGRLTIRGVTRDVELKVTRRRGGSGESYEAVGAIERKDFALGWGAALEAGGVLVGERVDLKLSLRFVASEG